MRRRKAIALLAIAAACGGGPAGPGARAPSDAPGSASAAAAASAAPEADDPVAAGDLARFVPAKPSLYAQVPSLDELRALLGAALVDRSLALLSAELAAWSDAKEAALHAVLERLDGAAVFWLDEPRLDVDAPRFGVILRAREAAGAEALLTSLGFRKEGGATWVRADPAITVAWLPEDRVAILSMERQTVDLALRAARGEAPSFATSSLHLKGRADRPWLAVDLARAGLGKLAEAGSKLTVALTSTGEADIDLDVLGDTVPRFGGVFGPSAIDVVGRLPAGAMAVTAISLKRRPQRSIRDAVGEVLRTFSSPALVISPEDAAKEIGTSFDEIERTIGDGVAIGSYVEPASKTPKPREPFDAANLVLVATRDDAAIKKLFAAVAKKPAPNRKPTPRGFVIEETGGRILRFEQTTGALAIGFGSKATIESLFRELADPKATLAASEGFQRERRALPSEASLLFFTDWGGETQKLGARLEADLSFLAGTSSFGSLRLAPSDRGLEIDGRFTGAPQLVAFGAAVAGYSVRRHLANAQTAEAKDTIAAIARGAVAAFERERVGAGGKIARHALCRSAVPVPPTVPKGNKHTPSTAEGKDFLSGDETSGWRCLKFEMSGPHRYQYEYRAGGPYKGPKRGGPDPGPRGFEVSAEGDRDGDGKTSLFTLTGRIDRRGFVDLDPEAFTADELE